jgi:uncharacterized protein (DUF1697 family)
MVAYAAFLRAVNVGGSGKLPMADLKAICEELGFGKVRTYIASGNVVFETKQPEKKVRELLEARLKDYAGKPVGVHVRTREELQEILASNPFADVPGNRHQILLLDETSSEVLIAGVKFKTNERLHAAARALHIHFPDGQGVSRLKVPGAEQGTARNRNTIEKIIELLGEG